MVNKAIKIPYTLFLKFILWEKSNEIDGTHIG